MNYKEYVEQKRKLVEPILKNVDPINPLDDKKFPEIIPKKKSKTIPKEEIKEDSGIRMTLDGIRGLYLVATGIGDKKMKKEELDDKLKKLLLTPKGFGQFQLNLANYFLSI